MRLTDLEKKLLNRIASSDYVYVHPEMTAGDTETWWWPDEFANDIGISEKALGGVAASMIKKGLMGLANEGTDEAGVWMTHEGFEAWRGGKTRLRQNNGESIMNENKLEVYAQLERIKAQAGAAAGAYYRAAMTDTPWQKRVEQINNTIDGLRASIDELEGMAK